MTPEQFADQITRDPWQMTLMEFVTTAAEFNAGVMHMSALRDDQPTVMVLCVRGEQECQEIAEAIATVQHRWELKRELAKGAECSES